MNRSTRVAGRIAWGTLFCVSLVAVAPVRADFRTPTAITNVTIVTETGARIESATILMFDGRIVDAGASVVVPAHARVIDGTGLFAYPGFVDAHAHLGISDTRRTTEERQRAEDVNPDTSQGPLSATRLANRKGIRPEFRAAELYVADEDQVKSHREAGFTTALIAPRDGYLSGTSDLMSLSGAPLRRLIVSPSVAMHASFSSGDDGGYPRSLLGAFSQFRQVLMDAEWYARQKDYRGRHPSAADRAVVDPALDALQPMLHRRQRLVFEANSENEIRRALDLAAEFNIDVAISGAKEAWKVVDRIKAENVELVVSLKFGEEPKYGKKEKKKGKGGKSDEKTDDDKPDAAEGDKSEAHAHADADKGDHVKSKQDKKDKKGDDKIYEPLKVRKEKRRLWEEQVANVIRLHEAGVPFAFRTRDFTKLSDFWKNLRLVIERGLPEAAAIEALTAGAARFAGVDDQLGTFRSGSIANVTVLDKKLSDEKAKVKFVMIDGKKFAPVDDKDKDEKKGKGKGKGRGRAGHGRHGDDEEAPSASKDDEEVADAESSDEPDDSPASESDDKEKKEKKDKGPVFATEIEADRVPKTHTGGDVVIQNATIIPVTSPTLTNSSILIQDGKIVAIGAIIGVPDGVTVIDGTGRFVIPGFVDCHSHLGLDGVNEGTLSITAEVRIADLIDPHSIGIYRAAAGGTTTHHVMHGSANPIGGQNAIVKTKYGLSAEEMLFDNFPRTIKFALGENVTRANFTRRGLGARRFPGSRMGVEAVIRNALETAKAYRSHWDRYAQGTREGRESAPPRRDLRLQALSEILSGTLTVHSHCYRSDEILRLLAVAEDYGFRIGTLQHVLEGYRIAPEIARHGSGASTFSNMWAYKIEAWGAIPHNAAAMTEHGINVSINSDSPNTIRYLGQEAAKCIKWGGLNENQALRLVTINPAMQLQVADRVGSLEVGKDGDVAIFNGHPLNTFSKCVMTIIEGEVFFEDARPESTEPAGVIELPGTLDFSIPQTSHRAYAIVDATVHPISGPAIEKATVVIVDDKIHAVGVDAVVPPGAGVINGVGLHVYPGLIDAGGNLGLYEIGQTPVTQDFRDTAALAPHLRAASAVHPHSELIPIARTVGITTALTKPSGGQISGQSAVIHLNGWTASEMLVVDTYALHISVPSTVTRPGIPGHMAMQRTKTNKEKKRKLNEFMDRAKHYAKAKKAASEDETIQFDVDLQLEAMVPYVRGEKPVVFAVGGYRHTLDTIEFAEKHKLRTVLAGGQHTWKLADVLAEKDIAVIFGNALGYPRGEFEPWDAIYRCAGVLDRAGVRFCFASESNSEAYDLAIQAGMAVAHGLPQERAEYALTLGAAKILGIDDRLGSIEVGKIADIIVTTGTPLQTVSQVTHMFIAGDPVELTSMHTRSYEKFKKRPAPALPPLPKLIGPPDLTTR